MTSMLSALLMAQSPATGAAPSSAITVTGCVQRIDNSGTLDTTISERTATPEAAGTLANLGEPAEGFILAVGTSGSNQVASKTARLKVASIDMVAGDCSSR